jgi:hypothetical protein
MKSEIAFEELQVHISEFYDKLEKGTVLEAFYWNKRAMLNFKKIKYVNMKGMNFEIKER